MSRAPLSTSSFADPQLNGGNLAGRGSVGRGVRNPILVPNWCRSPLVTISSQRVPQRHLGLRRASLLLLLPTFACRPAVSKQDRVPSPEPDTCETRVARISAREPPEFPGEFLYTCHLERAYRDYVQHMRSCSADSDCVGVEGACPLPGVVVNKAHATRVASIRDHVYSAFEFVADAKCCGAPRGPIAATCTLGLCERSAPQPVE